MYYIGLMSGTSMDATDAVLVNITENTIDILGYQQFSIDPLIQTRIRNITSDISVLEASQLDVELGEMFASAVSRLLNDCEVSSSAVSAIGSHGQTILHIPDDDYPRTIQLGDPNIIALRTGITTVCDFRRADMAVGGQGAPLAPLFHDWKFRSSKSNRIILNLGGMANITVLPADPDSMVIGFDTGPGNALLDIWIQHQLGKEFDQDGEWAMSGKVDANLLECFMSDNYFLRQPPKSTGKDEFNLHWITKNLQSNGEALAPEDVQATLLQLTAQTVCDAIEIHAAQTDEILVCGGGIHNAVLFKKIQERNKDKTTKSTEEYGIHPDAVEAVTFAWLACRRMKEKSGNLPSVTGAEKAVCLGGIYKGR